MIYELTPNDGRKSFYHKARVRRGADGTETLISYNTAVLRRLPSGELVRLWGGWSATTGRHIAAFAGINKKAWDALPVAPARPGPDMTAAESYRAMMGRRLSA